MMRDNYQYLLWGAMNMNELGCYKYIVFKS